MTDRAPAGPAVFLSPHFDDVALSCGGLAAQTGGLCLTLLAAPPPAGRPLSPYAQRLHDRWGEPDPQAGNALRRAEEQAATALLGLELLLLDYPDAIYREGRYLSHADIFGVVHAEELDLPATLAGEIGVALRARKLAPPVPIYAPLGLGNHVDHQLTFLAAARLAGQGWPVLYYEDFPYAAQPAAHEARFAALTGAGDPGTSFRPRYVAIDGTVERKITAIAAYRSQISSLFPSLEAMPQAVRAYAAAVAAAWPAGAIGGTQFAERYWRRMRE